MGIALGRLPRLLATLVLAFAPAERHPLLAVASLSRGLAMHLLHRWALGRVDAESGDRAVLTWSVLAGEPAPRGRRVLGALLVGAFAAVVCAGSTVVLLGVAHLGLRAWGVAGRDLWLVTQLLVVTRLVVLPLRVREAQGQSRRLTRLLPPARRTRWRVDYLAAVPAGRGHGGRVLAGFLSRADAAGAEVVLACDDGNVAFYRQFGFRPLGAGLPGQHLMSRPPSPVAPGARRASRPRRVPGRAAARRCSQPLG